RCVQLQRLLIDSQKHQIVVRRSFPALSAQQILEALLAPPRRRDEWQRWEKVAGKNHRRPKQTDCGKSQTTMACEPVHSKMLENCTLTANPKGGFSSKPMEAGHLAIRKSGTYQRPLACRLPLHFCRRDARRPSRAESLNSRASLASSASPTVSATFAAGTAAATSSRDGG